MRLTKTTVLLGATMLVPLLGSIQASHAQSAVGDDCDRLIEMLQRNPDANVTLNEARGYKTASNEEACRTALSKMRDATASANTSGSPDNAASSTAGSSAAASTTTPPAAPASAGVTGGNNIVVQQASPTISIEQTAPTVTVQQEPPTVSVSQGQPEVIVHQPAPVFTIELPKPEITIRMPKPNVEVAQAAPQIVINQAKPEVKIIAPPSADNISVGQAANPIVKYESEQPQVHITQAQGEPTVKFEQLDSIASVSAATATATDALPAAQGPQVAVSELNGKPVVGPQGQTLGTVKLVIMDGRNHPFLIVERASVAGQNAKDIPIAAQNARLEGDHITTQGLNQTQINGIKEYKSETNYKTVTNGQTISMARSPS